MKDVFKKTIIYWLPPLIWALIIYALSARPTGTVSEIHWGDFVIKKTAHFIEYFIFCTLWIRAFINSGIRLKQALYFSFLISVIYGLTDEFHQSFTPGRTPNVRDVVFDSAGAFFSVYFVTLLVNKLPADIRKIVKRLDL